MCPSLRLITLFSAFAAFAVGFCQTGAQPANNAELQALKDADQTAREASAIDWTTLSQEDAKRRARVAEMLAARLIVTGQDYSNAALIYQHGDTPHDFLQANEFVVVACALGKIDGLGAASQDRFLVSINKLQRFGTQYDVSKDNKQVQKPTMEAGNASVTDDLRLNLLVPSLASERANPLPGGFKAFQPVMQNRLLRNFTPGWEEKEDQGAVASGLHGLAQSPSVDSIPKVIELYRRDQIESAQELRDAASILLTSSDPDEILLANDFSMAAAARADRQALVLYARTLDKYLTMVGQEPRFGTIGGKPLDPTVSGPMRRAVAGVSY